MQHAISELLQSNRIVKSITTPHIVNPCIICISAIFRNIKAYFRFKTREQLCTKTKYQVWRLENCTDLFSQRLLYDIFWPEKRLSSARTVSITESRLTRIFQNNIIEYLQSQKFHVSARELASFYRTDYFHQCSHSKCMSHNDPTL